MTRSRLVPVLLAAVLLVGAANLGAYAANGGPLLLGKGNKAAKTTKLKTTGNGAALSLKSKAGAAPLAVSNSSKVTNLNADLVDGLEGDALKTKSFVYNLTATGVTESHVNFALPNLPAGRYLASFSVTLTATGSTLVGCYILTGSGPTAEFPVLAVADANGPDAFSATGSGFVDTSTATYRFGCERNGGTTMTIPTAAQVPARVVFIRLDDVAATPVTGVGSASTRSAPGLVP